MVSSSLSASESVASLRARDIRCAPPEERKQLQRTLSSAEKKVKQLETKIAAYETQMADSSFFENPDSAKALKDYNRKKEELEMAMMEWMEAQEALE